eukprot:gene28658-31834_t
MSSFREISTSASSWASLAGRNGMPGPRPEVVEEMSTFRGGHISRLIRQAETVVQLDDILFECRKKISPSHIALAALRLEQLYQLDKSLTRHVAKVAAELERLAASRAPRLTAWQASLVVRGLNNSNHKLKEESLLALAAVLIQDKCQRLELAAEDSLKDIFYGFGSQEFSNPVFWQRLCDFTTPRISSMGVKNLTAMLHSLSRVQERHTPFLEASSVHLLAHMGEVGPKHLANVAAALSVLRFSSPDLVAAITAQAVVCMPTFDGKSLALLAQSLRRVGPPMTPELASAAAARALACAADLQPFYVAKLVKALGQQGVKDKKFYEAMLAQIRPKLSSCTQGIASLLVVSFEHAPEGARKQLKEDLRQAGVPVPSMERRSPEALAASA